MRKMKLFIDNFQKYFSVTYNYSIFQRINLKPILFLRGQIP